MNGITDAQAPIRDHYTLGQEMVIWLLFSVLLSLFYFGLTLLVWYLSRRDIDWVELLKSGGLVTYASTLSAKSAGEYFKSLPGRILTIMTPLCVIGLVCILIATSGVYGALLSLGTVATAQVNVKPSISGERLAHFSWIIAVIAIVYAFVFTFYARRKGKAQ